LAFADLPLTAPEALSAAHEIEGFACGVVDLDVWLKTRARASEGRTARTFVVAAGRKVVGYYCLAAGAVVRGDLPKKLARDTPDHVPVLILGRLAVDEAAKGRGIGHGLLKDALGRSLAAADSIGVRAVVVHVRNDQIAGFYRKFGFLSSPLDARTLVLPIETLKAALSAEQRD